MRFWKKKKERDRTRTLGLCHKARKRAVMPDEVIKSGEQNVVEAEVVGFEKEFGPFVVAAGTTRMSTLITNWMLFHSAPRFMRLRSRACASSISF